MKKWKINKPPAKMIFNTLLSSMCILFPLKGAAQDCESKYIENNGLVVVEIESEEPETGWTFNNNLNGYSDLGHFEWTSSNKFNNPGNGKLTYKIKINTPGTYEFYWHCKTGKGSDPTEHNDSWLRIPDASDFYAVKSSNNDTVRPKGVCTDDCPNGAGSDGWFKVYSSGTLNWTWTGRTSDHDPHQVKANFDTAGIYTVEISGRSNGHVLDKFIMFTPPATLVSAKEAGETICPGYEKPTYQVKFNVRGGSTVVPGATMLLDTMEVITGDDGRASFDEVHRGADIPYTVVAEGYDTLRGTVHVVKNITETIYLTPATAIDTRTNSQQYRIYPNPTNDILHIDGLKKNTIITINDITGREIASMKQNNNSFMINHLPKGIYLISIQEENKNNTFVERILLN